MTTTVESPRRRSRSATMAILALAQMAAVGLYFRSRSASSYSSAGASAARQQHQRGGLVGILVGESQSSIATADDAGGEGRPPYPASSSPPTLTVDGVDGLIDSLAAARLRFDRRMGTAYGEQHRRTIFSRANATFAYAGEASRERLLRRIMIKLLRSSSSSSPSPPSTLSGENATTATPTTFTWATGGHSAAAGHGNLYSQSYTAVMESHASDAFSSVGLRLLGKNYAMGAMSSGPELSMCMDAVYGPDVDVLSWDFGMTDGRAFDKIDLWCHRAALHPSWPILVLRGDAGKKYRWDRFRSAAAGPLNMGVVGLDPGPVFDALRDALPDAARDGEESQNNLTLPLRYLMCNGGRENGMPCRDYKYSTAPCTRVGHQVKWHPGWKEHMLQGILMASFLIEALEESLVELRRRLSPRHRGANATADPGDGGDPNEAASASDVLESLLGDDRRDRDDFLDSTPPDNLPHPADANITDALGRGRSFCRTGLLPSQSRFDGLVTGSGRVGDVVDGGYDAATPRAELDDGDHPTVRAGYDDPRPIPLVAVGGPGDQCEVPTSVDVKDVFLVREVDGWVGMSIPSDDEVAWAGGGGGGGDGDEGGEEEREGLIMVCLRMCGWGKCPHEHITFKELREESEGGAIDGGGGGGNITIHVDGNPVVGVREFHGCHFLEGSDGLRWGRGRNGGAGAGAGAGGGRFELKFRANRPGGELRITSVVVL